MQPRCDFDGISKPLRVIPDRVVVGFYVPEGHSEMQRLLNRGLKEAENQPVMPARIATSKIVAVPPFAGTAGAG